MRHDQAKALYASAKNPEAGKPVANNTRVVRRDINGTECYAVRLHKTDILTFLPDGAVAYDSGGWKTVTTKARMNEYGPARVESRKGAWTINGMPYLDGCIVRADGTIEGAGDNSTLTEDAKTRKAVGAYAKAYVSRLFAGEIGSPSAGDCWACCMRAADGSRPMGGADHIRSHLEERYYVPSLAWNALKDAGAGDAYKQALHEAQNGKFDGWLADILRRDLPRWIRRHCLKELGMSY